MKKIFFSLLAFMMMNSSLFALKLDQIQTRVSKDLDSALVVLATKSSVEQKSKELFTLFDEYFDYTLMSRLALGKLYNSLNDEQKEEFKSKFEERLKLSFSEKLALYTNEKITIASFEQPNDKRYFLHTNITTANGENYKLSFKFHRAKDNDYLVYDVDILGVSLIQTYRAQFEDLGSRADFNVILERLNATNELDKKDKTK